MADQKIPSTSDEEAIGVKGVIPSKWVQGNANRPAPPTN